MTVGIAAASANSALDTWLDSTFIKLHTGDPGSAGASNASSVTTRPAATFSAASAGSKSITTTLPSWASWAGTNGEVVTHVSIWTASSAGTFKGSVALTASKTVNTGDTLTLNTLTGTITPIAA